MAETKRARACGRPLVFLTGEFPPQVGGVAEYTALLRAALAAIGRWSSVVARRGPGVAEQDVHRDVLRWDTPSLLGVVRRLAPDAILHLQYQPAAFDLRGDVCLLPLLVRRLRPDVRTAVTFHDARVPYLFPKAGPLRAAALRLLARSADVAIAADEMDLRALRPVPWRSHLIPIGTNVANHPPPAYDRERFRAALGLQPDDLAVAYFGLLNASKGLDTLLDAFRHIGATAPRSRLLVLGDASGASDATDAATAATFARLSRGLTGRIVRTGHLPPEQLSAHLLAADVALLPYVDGVSLRRGSFLACLEHGLPVVTTRGPGLDSRVVTGGSGSARPGDAALVVPVGDAPALAEAALWLTTDRRRMRQYQTAAAALMSRLSWPTIARAHREVYARLDQADRPA